MYVLGAPAPSRLNVGLGEADIALSPSGERIVKLAPSGASDAWRGEIPLSTPANQQAGKPPYLSPEGERATSHNVRFRSSPALQLPHRVAKAALTRNSPRMGIAQFALQHLRSEEHTSELQSLMRISYAVFCLKIKKKKHTIQTTIDASIYQYIF